MGGPHASLATKFAIYETLRSVLVTDGSEYCSYQDGWSDKRVADEHQVEPHVIRRLRLDSFGKLQATPATIVGLDDIQRLLAEQAKTLARHQHILDHLCREFNIAPGALS